MNKTSDMVQLAYINVALIVGDRWDRLKKRGQDKGLSESATVVLWVLAAVVIVGGAYGVFKVFIQKQTDQVTNSNPIGT